jgi:serine phosphatase RsbU (regulator of sigma subunit)
MALAADSPMHRLQYAKAVRPHLKEYVSGDAAVIRERDHIVLAAIADVLGHGPEAYEVAVEVEKFLMAHWNESTVALMDQLHGHLQGSRGAAAGICLVDRQSGLLRYTGIGNTAIRRFGSSEARLLSRPGIVGGNRRTPSEEQMTLSPGDVIVLYTDGVKDRFELQDYPQILHHPAESIARTIIQRFGKQYDDASCIALKYEQ